MGKEDKMTIADEKYENEDFKYNMENDYIGSMLGTTWCAIKYGDGSILVISVDPYDHFTGDAVPVESFADFPSFENWVKGQGFYEYHPEEYKSLA